MPTKVEWTPIPDTSLDFMAEDPCAANHPAYTPRLVREVMQLQGVILAFLAAWDSDPANVVRMNDAIRDARKAIGQEEPEGGQ
jgi:hypothetical protein